MTSALSMRDRMIAAAARWGVRPLLMLPVPWRVYRRSIALVAPLSRRRSPCAEAWDEIAGVPTMTVTPPNASGSLVWLHGGGFVLGSPDSYRRLAHRLALRSRLRLVLPRYRLAPEHPFPAAYDDALAVARVVSSEGRWWLGGDSAGGNLALGACAACLTDGAGPERMALISPAPDLDAARTIPDGNDEMLLPEGLLRRAVADYLGAADPSDPRASPLRARFRDPPPTLIQCSAGEMLEGDIDALAAHLRAQGGEVRVEKIAGMPHDYQVLAGFAPAADRAVDAIADFLRGAP
jgi:acetyl esterase/lipase